jgi:hypothetical protein
VAEKVHLRVDEAGTLYLDFYFKVQILAYNEHHLCLGPDRPMPPCPWAGMMHGTRPSILQRAMRPTTAVEFDAQQ